MKPVMQTLFGEPEGNCWQACIASILELEIGDVPHIIPKRGSSAWVTETNKWLADTAWMELMSVYINPDDVDVEEALADLPDTYCIANGPGPRGLRHAVIYRAGRLVHDPHPEGGGLEGVEEFEYFVSLRPEKFMRAARAIQHAGAELQRMTGRDKGFD